jgi:hypothetical protein
MGDRFRSGELLLERCGQQVQIKQLLLGDVGNTFGSEEFLLERCE